MSLHMNHLVARSPYAARYGWMLILLVAAGCAGAQKRFEQILPQFADDPIVLRSAYLFRAELWPDDPGRSLHRFLQKVFHGEGTLHGFVMVARSFLKTGFYEHAAAAARLGVAVCGKSAQARSTRAQQIREDSAELDRIAARAEAQLAALQESAR